MRIGEVIDKIKKYHKDWQNIDPTHTRDQVLYGNTDQECTGIVTTCWASSEVIRKAYEAGANLVICHEALFWNHGDKTDWLEETNNRTFRKKEELLKKTGLAVWRNHDHIHSGIPVNGGFADGIFYGMAKKLGWEGYLIDSHSKFDSTMFLLPEIQVREIAALFRERFHLNGVKLIGNPDMAVKKMLICMHVLGRDNDLILRIDQEGIDLAVALEMVDFTAAEYVQDSVQLGEKKAIMTVGHFNTEEPGMEYMLTYLDELFPDIPCRFIQSGDMYQYLTGGEKGE